MRTATMNNLILAKKTNTCVWLSDSQCANTRVRMSDYQCGEHERRVRLTEDLSLESYQRQAGQHMMSRAHR